MTDRIKRVNQLIKEKIADILLREVNFDKNVLATVQNVDTSRDLKHAKVGISIMPFEKSEQALKILQKQTNNIQKQLNKAIEIKFVPKIEFEIDRSEEKTSRIEELLREIK